jgi:RimJ/RimL family protein N-acetyltransferase
VTAVNPDVILETERLMLRRFADTDADAELLFELDSDPEVMRYIGPFGLPSVAAYRERIRTYWQPYYARPPRAFGATFEKTTGRFIGWFFLRDSTDYKFAKEAGWTRPSDLELGYRLRHAAWGRGFATEAASALVKSALADPAVTAVVSVALVTNRGSWRVMEKVGMTHVRDFSVADFADPFVVYEVCRAGEKPPGA